jgi:predicted DNA-binding transcriptional regulator YafY
MMLHAPIHRNLHYAIQNHFLIEFAYEGEGVRIAEPFCLGKTTAGNVALRAYQLRGYSNSLPQQWKLFDLSKITELKILSETFDYTQRENYHVGDKAMDTIFVQVY